MRFGRQQFLWGITALLGIAVTAALTWSIARVTTQHIGLASTPLSVIHGLAPTGRDRATALETGQARSHHAPRRHHRRTSTATSPAGAGVTSAPSYPATDTSTPTMTTSTAAPPATISPALSTSPRSTASGPARGSGSSGSDDSSRSSRRGPDD